MSVCIAVIHLLVIFFISSSVRDPKNDFLLLAILNSAAVTVLVTVSQCKEMRFFPIHHFDQIATKMDLFLMKLFLIKFPGTPRQCWGRRPGAGGMSTALRGGRNTLTLGLVVSPVKVAGIWAWGHSMGSLGVPDIPKFPPSPCASTCQLLPPANHPLSSPEACAYPTGLVSSPLQMHLCFDPRIEVESVGTGVLALSLTCCVLHLSKPQFPHLFNGDNSSTCLLGLL